MRGVCAHVREQVPRLREAQRAFWLAWKAVSAGDREALQEARRAQDALEGARFDLLKLMEVSWDASRFAVMEEKTNYRLAEQYTHPRCLQGRWVELPDGRILEYDRNLFTIWIRGHKGRYRAERFVDEPNNVQTIHAIGDNEFIVCYVDTHPCVWRLDDQGSFVRDYKILSLGLTTHIQRVGRLSDGRIALTTGTGMKILARHEGKYLKEQDFFSTTSLMRPSVHVNDTVVSMGFGSDHEQHVLIRKLNARGMLTVVAELPRHSSSLYEYQPDGRVMEFDEIKGAIRCYQDDENGAYAQTGSWLIDRRIGGLMRALAPRSIRMLSYDRMLLVSDESVEVWRVRHGREAIRESRTAFEGLRTDVYVLPNGRLVTVNEEVRKGSDWSMRPMMRMWLLDEHGVYKQTDAFEQTIDYTHVTPRPDGRIFVNMHNDELLIFDGDPVARGV